MRGSLFPVYCSWAFAVLFSEQRGEDCRGAREGSEAVCRSGSDMPNIPISP